MDRVRGEVMDISCKRLRVILGSGEASVVVMGESFGSLPWKCGGANC